MLAGDLDIFGRNSATPALPGERDLHGAESGAHKLLPFVALPLRFVAFGRGGRTGGAAPSGRRAAQQSRSVTLRPGVLVPK